MVRSIEKKYSNKLPKSAMKKRRALEGQDIYLDKAKSLNEKNLQIGFNYNVPDVLPSRELVKNPSFIGTADHRMAITDMSIFFNFPISCPNNFR